MKVEYIDIEKLKEHEEVIHNHLHCLCDEIKESKWVYPILVDEKSLVILDGHHRFNALKKLGISKIPCILIDYQNDDIIHLDSWRDGEVYTKKGVIEHALAGMKFPPKTTKHILLKKINYEKKDLLC